MTQEEALRIARDWTAAWNRHDIDAALANHTDDFAMTAPNVRRVPGIESGTLTGKQAVETFFFNTEGLVYEALATYSG
jgi:ketosteroid isomerase-like protein